MVVFIDQWKEILTIIYFFLLFVIFGTIDEMKRNYQEIQEKSEEEIQIISSKTKNAIDLARPFYEARRQTNEYLKQLKIDSLNLEKSKTNLAAAKEMVRRI